MKKIMIIISCWLFVFICIAVVNNSQIESTAVQNTSGYAKILKNNVYLYKFLPLESAVDTKYFLLEQSYFVKVLNKESEDYFKVEYMNVKGYVKRTEIEFVEEMPEYPFPVNITFDIYPLSSVELRSEPSTKGGIGTILLTLPQNTKNIDYVGKISGEESSLSLGNIWYFCCYETPEGNEINGYVYSPLTTNLSSITTSTENLTPVSVTDFVSLDSLLYLNISTESLILIVITLPILLILYLFIKPTKILKE